MITGILTNGVKTIIIEKLDRLYPNENEYMNRELSQLLIYLDAPGVVTKTLALLDKAKTQEEQAHYIFYLRNMTTQWTLDQRKHYFDWFKFAQEATKGEITYPKGSPYLVWADQKKAGERHPAALLKWFKEAGRDYGDGASYPKYLVNIRKDAIAALTPLTAPFIVAIFRPIEIAIARLPAVGQNCLARIVAALAKILRLDVADVQEAVASHAKIDERRLDARLQVHDPSLVNITHVIALAASLQIQLFQ